MTTIIVVVGAVCLALGGGGGFWVAHQSSKAQVAEAESAALQAEAKAKEAEAAAAATEAAGGIVKQAVADELAKTALNAEVLGAIRAKWLCEGEHYDQVACTTYLLCSQVAAGTVQATACDAAVNQWVSERQLAIIESDEADKERRDERRRQFEKRK